MKEIKYKYGTTDVTLFLNPGEYLSDQDFESKIINKIEQINTDGNYNLSYGIFNKRLSLSEKKDIFKKMIISIMEIDNKPICFNYHLILSDEIETKPIVHLGLLMQSHNPGLNLAVLSYINSLYILKKIKKNFFVTNIAADPFYIGDIARTYSQIWPSPYLDNKNPPQKNYRQVINICFEDYVKKFFPFPENSSIDNKRSVLLSKAKEMGFETDMRKMARDHDVLVNTFCMFWLNYENQETMIQVGLVDNTFKEKINKKIKEEKIKFI